MKRPYLALAALIALFLSAIIWDQPHTTPETPEMVTIDYWEKWTSFEAEGMRATVDMFNKKKIKNSKGQVIFCNYLTITQVDRKSLLSIAANHPPDVAGFWSFNLHVFADMGALIPLDKYIERDKIDKDKYMDVFWNGCQHKGHTWCLPSTPATNALHWNKDMFKEVGLDPERPPRTLEELKEFSDKLTKPDKDGKPTQMGFLPVEPGWWNYAWGYFWGGKLNDGMEKITANDPKNIEAWKYLMGFKKGFKSEYLLSFAQSFGDAFDSPQNAFMSGKVAMVLQGVWMANFIKFNNPQMNWGCAPFPSSFDTHGNPFSMADMDVLTIPRGAAHPDEAWELIKFINTTEAMEFLCASHGKLTPFKTNTPGWIEHQSHPYLRVFIDLARSKNALVTPKLAVWDEYKKELTAAFDRVWMDKATPEEALNDVQARMQPKLDRALKVLNQRKDGAE